MTRRISQVALFGTLPPLWPEELRPQIRAAVAARPDHKLVVLDDDPTGTQTVYDVPVLTGWHVDALRAELAGPHACFYVLTNSRSLPAEPARKLVRELARNLRAAAGILSFTLVSRSDSTLRGHFPLETDVLAEELGPFAGTILIPYFEDGGRYTINDVHYVAEDDSLVPAAETPFAQDAAFGYRSSNLREWVEEKTAGRLKAAEIAAISLSQLREGGPAEVTKALLELGRGSVCIVNAAAPQDLDVFVAATLAAEAQGRRYCFRTAAQFVSARLGLERRPLLRARTVELLSRPVNPQPAEGQAVRDYAPPGVILPPLHPHRELQAVMPADRDESAKLSAGPSSRTGGLVVVGSYVPKTTLQLSHLPTGGEILQLELRVEKLLTSRREDVLRHILTVLTAALTAGQDAVVFTSRQLVRGDNATSSLQIGHRVSAALVELVQRLEVRPRYLVAKGGITSSDLATKGLGVKRAMVIGQILPGVPVWRLGLETKFPGLPYVVFPGNVGGPTGLWDVVRRLRPGEIEN